MRQSMNGRGPLRKGHGRKHNRQLRGAHVNTAPQQLEVGDNRGGLSPIARIGDIREGMSSISAGGAL
jgi:hypothetical protein